MQRSLQLLAALAITLLITVGCTVNPVTGKNQLDLMGETQELELGRQLYPQYTQVSLGEVPDRRLQAYVEDVGERLARVSHRPDLPYQYNAVNDPAVNAYALPGGKVSITRGLLARLDNEDELAAVLGHETGHVTARHAAQQYTRAMLTQLALLGGTIYLETHETRNRQLYELGGMLGASLMLARYSRDQERQSDELGMQYMVAAGYSPQGTVGVMEVLAATSKREPGLVERMFGSHPLTSQRIAAARQELAQLPADVRARPLHRQEFKLRTDEVRRQRPAYDRLAEARSLLAAGEKAAKARPLLQKSVDEWPNDGVLRSFLAAVELDLDGARRAAPDAARAAAAAPGVFYPQLVAGRVFVDGQRWAEALNYLDRAAALLPDVANVQLLRGTALENLGRRRDAVAAYTQVRSTAPAESDAAQEATKRLQRLGAL